MSIEAGSDTTTSDQPNSPPRQGQPQLSLATAAARNLATTTKSVPQMRGISSRWLLRMLPWVDVAGGVYRVNQRRRHADMCTRLEIMRTADTAQVMAPSLRNLPLLQGFDDDALLGVLADQFTQREFTPGEVIAKAGQPIDELFVIAHGKVTESGSGPYGGHTLLAVLTDGQHFGADALCHSTAAAAGRTTAVPAARPAAETEPRLRPGNSPTADTGSAVARRWPHTMTALTTVTTLSLSRDSFAAIRDQSEELSEHVRRFRAAVPPARNQHDESVIELRSGHTTEITLPGTFVDYELTPREYELSVAQTVLRVSSRVADLYNGPMDQVEQQLRLTVEALRERQEAELITNPDFGLLHNVDEGHRLTAYDGPPTPDDLDELLSRQRDPQFFLAHPRTIAAFGRECNRRGLYPGPVTLHGSHVTTWRGVPMLPCDKLPVSGGHTSTILLLRTGEDDQGVIGLHQTGIPDEYQPSLSVRLMGINDQAVISYLVSAYFSIAVLVPDALCALENVEISRPRD